MSGATIRADALQLVLFAHKLRRHTHGGTCQLCALSAAPMIEVDCCSASQWVRPGLIAQAKRFGASHISASLLRRGHISRLYERVRLERGLAEVKRTWRTGLRALRAEPRHVLNGGDASA
jgi:hypothetical protein